MVRNYGSIYGEVQGSIWVRSPSKHQLLIMKEVAERLGSWQHFSELHGIKGAEAKSRSGWTRSRLDTCLYLDYRRAPTDNKIKTTREGKNEQLFHETMSETSGISVTRNALIKKTGCRDWRERTSRWPLKSIQGWRQPGMKVKLWNSRGNTHAHAETDRHR